MKIDIDKQSEVPVRHQVSEQIVFLIGTGRLSNGDTLPSVRELARQLKVHHNTVSHAYAELVRKGWLVNRRGSRMVVVQRSGCVRNGLGKIEDLDDLINRTIQLAREHGYSLQQLGNRIHERLLEEPPDHLLIVGPERELGELIREEIHEAIGQVSEVCPVSMLQQTPTIAIGAIVVTPSYLVDDLACLPPKDRSIVPITYSTVDDHLANIRSLPKPCIVGVLSVSPAFLRTARGVLAPAISQRHSFQEFLIEQPHGVTKANRPKFIHYLVEEHPTSLGPRRWETAGQESGREAPTPSRESPETTGGGEFQPLSSSDLRAIDILFCDSIAYRAVKHPRATRYRLLSEESLRQIASAAQALVTGTGH